VKGILLSVLVVLVAGCGGGSGGGSDSSTSPSSSAAAPTITLSANPTSVASGQTSTLSWTATNASSCSASGAWSGNQATSGTFQTPALTADSTFTLNCTGAGGGVVSRVTVTISNSNSASVQLTASPPGVAPNGSTTLTWNSSNVTSCSASGAWSGSQPTSGSTTVGPLTQDQTYQLTCTGTSGNAMAMTTVTIRQAVLSWTEPTQNVDGSPLTDLAGYKLYSRNESGSYGAPAVINGASTTTYTMDLNPGTYFFALSAFNSSGAESAKTNEVSKTVY
jgi:hypothetical protein